MSEYTLTTSTGMAAQAREHYRKVMLGELYPELIFDKYAKKHTIPTGEGATINWNRPTKLDVSTTPLQEGVTPPASQLNFTKVSASVLQYGRWIGLTDKVPKVSINPVLDTAAEVLGQNAGETMDVLAASAYYSGTTVRYANNQLSRGAITATDVINGDDLRRIHRDLTNNSVPPFKAGGKAYYVALVHPFVHYDLQAIAEWQNAAINSDPGKLYEGQVEMLWGFMFVSSVNAEVFEGAGSGGIDVYGSLFFGRDALGSADIEGLDLEMIYHGLGSSGAADPLNQRQTSAWKSSYVAKILDERRVVRYESAASE
jgi:N4-gp56 family major capsid protein